MLRAAKSLDYVVLYKTVLWYIQESFWNGLYNTLLYDVCTVHAFYDTHF